MEAHWHTKRAMNELRAQRVVRTSYERTVSQQPVNVNKDQRSHLIACRHAGYTVCGDLNNNKPL